MSATTEPCVFDPRWLTGNRIVDDEHARLLEMVFGLRAICRTFDRKESCSGCAADKVAACEDRVFACISELMDYMVEHFGSEERLMKDLGLAARRRLMFEEHVEDHARLAGHLSDLTLPGAPEMTVGRIADLSALVLEWLDHHIRIHDVPMMQ